VNILTHCNAGWLATVDWGTALAPIYMAHDKGLDVHVWVDETRPRNQGAALTAWELGSHGVAHTIVADNAGGHLMQRGDVDMVIVGTDRTTRTGDVANKIGTYLKALAATTTACRSTWRCRIRPSTGRSPTAPRSRSRSARATR
jgi:methylthioribose-1-phosphate isomerase